MVYVFDDCVCLKCGIDKQYSKELIKDWKMELVQNKLMNIHIDSHGMGWKSTRTYVEMEKH